MKKKIAYQFRIELVGIEPIIWRLIEVPSTYSFWDLHVAIQDSMGWLDYHLHVFNILPPRKKKPILIGIPVDECEANTLPGWEIPIMEYFREPGDEARYEYDFGDGWIHRIVLEGIYLQKDNAKYPNCMDGQRACPVEDCGGISGYYNLLEILSDPKHEEYEHMTDWLSGDAKSYAGYDPEHFEPGNVTFDNPKKRWKKAFQN